MSFVFDFIDWLASWAWWLGGVVWGWLDDNLVYAAAVAVYGVARMLGTVVESGSRGVLFRFGRIHKELSPGFHFLAPIIHGVRKFPVRSVTFKLPAQRITDRDGLVYDVEANVVYHVEHPVIAAVQIDNVHQGCRVVVPLVVAELIGQQASESLADRSKLEREFSRCLQARFDRWGLVVERVGFKSIAPTRESLRITQLSAWCEERFRVYRALHAAGESTDDVLALLGAPSRLIEHAARRCRGYRQRYAKRKPSSPLPDRDPTALRVGDRVWVNWLELGEYYPGKITKISWQRAHIEYDDGDTEATHIRNVSRKEPTKE